MREIRADIANTEALAKARATKANPSVSVKSADTAKKKQDNRTAVARESKLPERKIRLAQEIKKADPGVSEMKRESAEIVFRLCCFVLTFGLC